MNSRIRAINGAIRRYGVAFSLSWYHLAVGRVCAETIGLASAPCVVAGSVAIRICLRVGKKGGIAEHVPDGLLCSVRADDRRLLAKPIRARSGSGLFAHAPPGQIGGRSFDDTAPHRRTDDEVPA